MIDDWGLMQHAVTQKGMSKINQLIKTKGVTPVQIATASSGCAHLVERMSMGPQNLSQQAAEIITMFSRYDALFRPGATYNATSNVFTRYEMEIATKALPIESWLKDCVAANLITHAEFDAL